MNRRAPGATPSRPSTTAAWSATAATTRPVSCMLSSLRGHRSAARPSTRSTTAHAAREPSPRGSTSMRATSRSWRAKNFYPVLPEGAQGDPRQALLVRMLELKREIPLPLGGAAAARTSSSDSIARSSVPSSEEFEDFAKDHPLWGMPYALPGSRDDEHAALVSWVEAGTPSEPRRAARSRRAERASSAGRRSSTSARAQGAADGALHLRAPVPGLAVLRGRRRAHVLSYGALAHAAPGSRRRDRHAASVRRSRQPPVLLPHRAARRHAC